MFADSKRENPTGAKQFSESRVQLAPIPATSPTLKVHESKVARPSRKPGPQAASLGLFLVCGRILCDVAWSHADRPCSQVTGKTPPSTHTFIHFHGFVGV